MNILKKKNFSILMFLLAANMYFSSSSFAYEKYTWSELVTGKINKNIDECDDKITVISEWCGLSRLVKSDIPNYTKLKNALLITKNKKNYSKEAYYKAVMDLRYLYKFEYKDDKKADEVLSYLFSDSDLKSKAEVEKLFSTMDDLSILDNDFYSKLKTLSSKESLFPYDNGYMPVITSERVKFLLSIKDMIDGKSKFYKAVNVNCWKKIPSDILFFISTDKRDTAYKIYVEQKSKIDSASRKLIEDFLFPLYMPVKPANRKFLAAIYCIEEFHNLGIHLIHESLNSSSRMTKPEHALACLSDVYIRHNAHNESQKVFSLLSEYYPNSLWLK